MMHKIVIKEITVPLHIGVTEAERRRRQRIAVSVELYPAIDYTEINDSIERTLNYSLVRNDVVKLLKSREHRLIETVAREVAELIKKRYPVEKVKVTVAKYPYKDTKLVSYSLEI